MTHTDLISPREAPTLYDLFKERVQRTPHGKAYRYCNTISGQWHTLKWQEAYQHVTQWRAALAGEQLAPGERIALMLPNCPEWVYFDIAAQSLGLIVVPLYVNDRPENIGYIMKDTGARLFLCPGSTCWDHLSPVFNQIESLKRIITIDFCHQVKDDPRIACISDWLPEKAEDIPELSVSPEDTATIVYTSGTTGRPKGVMLSHNNIINNAYTGLQCIDCYPSDIFLSFLPLSHMLERCAGYYMPMMSGSSVAFARSIPDLAEDIRHIKPTVLVSVPRIFEKIYSKIQHDLEAKPPVIRKLFETAVRLGWHKFEISQNRAKWCPGQLLQPLTDLLVAKKVRTRLGGRLRVIISGGAPLSADIAKVFIGLGLPIYQGYGLTETSPVISVNTPAHNIPASVGRPIPGFEVKIGEHDELLARGPSVMLGYWNRPEATAETIDTEGWIHTGDKVKIIDEHIYITGRLKDIIVLSNGLKVSPGDVEQAISLDPLFEQTMIIGEGKPYLVLLAVLARDRWEILAKEIGVAHDASALNQEIVQKVILSRVEKLLHGLPGPTFIKHAVLSLEPWTVQSGLLTPTMKLKRKSIMNHLQDEIDTIYGD
ncbi:AMP-dependent synthetase/ligase [Desulfosediminicola ganghwensis]|uniref:AMP-dependent synthetase/ligase n=1 Tax=Desulfosediminicola ganghwensis TaxID=2569540 RepID=UPI0010AD0A9B|nr:AMP-dependent synthetase/ligase [Desulfosediminicola ganghwensis]